MNTDHVLALASSSDECGVSFRPGFHRANPDGTPYFATRRGKRVFMPSRAKRPTVAPNDVPKVETSAVPPPNVETPKTDVPHVPPVPEPKPDFSDVARIVGSGSGESAEPGATFAPVDVVQGVTFEASTEGILRSSYVVADALLSGRGDWQPEDATEHDGLKAAIVAFQKSRGGKPLPPGWALLAAVAAFVLKRVKKPNTAKTLAKWFPDLAPMLGVEPVKPEPEKPAPVKPSAPAVVVRRKPEDYFA